MYGVLAFATPAPAPRPPIHPEERTSSEILIVANSSAYILPGIASCLAAHDIPPGMLNQHSRTSAPHCNFLPS